MQILIEKLIVEKEKKTFYLTNHNLEIDVINKYFDLSYNISNLLKDV
jgi:hypothetical protein